MRKYESRPIDSLNRDYSCSSLENWFELDVWQPKEAMCLICDIDPFMADIDWSDKISIGPGVNVDGPIIKNALLLSKEKMFYYFRRELTDEQIDRYGPPWEYLDPKKLSKKDKHLAYAADKDLLLDDAEEKLIRLWKIFRRAKDAKDIDLNGTNPQWYVQWALKRGFKIPWLDWAEQHGFLVEESITETRGDKDVPKPLTPSDKRRNEGMEAAIAILRQKQANGELNDWQSFERCVKKAVVVDYIREKAADFPNCSKIKSKSDKNQAQSVKDREPTLTKSFPDFTKDPSIVAEYERLIGME